MHLLSKDDVGFSYPEGKTSEVLCDNFRRFTSICQLFLEDSSQLEAGFFSLMLMCVFGASFIASGGIAYNIGWRFLLLDAT